MGLYGQCAGNAHIDAGGIYQCGGQQAQPQRLIWDRAVRGDTDITQWKYCVVLRTVMTPLLLSFFLITCQWLRPMS